MAYLGQGGGQSGADNTAELAAQTTLLTAIKDELLAQGLSLDTVNGVLNTISTTLSTISSSASTTASNTSSISSSATAIETDAAAIEAELLDQGLVQDDLKTLLEFNKTYQREMLNKITQITEYLEYIGERV